MKLFVDLDNTLTDWDGAVRKLGQGPSKGLGDSAKGEDKQVMYKAINDAGEAFWENLEWALDGRQLWDLFKPFHPILLSSPGDFRSASAGKFAWVKKNIPGTTLYLSKTKSEYVDPYEMSVLVDDDKHNIMAWKERGGIGILHQSLASTERQFLELLWNEPPDVNPADIYW
jgi:hypothetical protein